MSLWNELNDIEIGVSVQKEKVSVIDDRLDSALKEIDYVLSELKSLDVDVTYVSTLLNDIYGLIYDVKSDIY